MTHTSTVNILMQVFLTDLKFSVYLNAQRLLHKPKHTARFGQKHQKTFFGYSTVFIDFRIKVGPMIKVSNSLLRVS